MSALTRYPVPQATAAGKVDGPRLLFRLEPTIVPEPVLAFLRPLRGLEVIEAGAVDDPRLYFRLEAAVVPGRIMSSLAAHGGLAGLGGIAGQGGGLAG
jgi:hypothetical protein